MKTISTYNNELSPSKVVCIGRNYVAHIEELDNEMPKDMVIFNKPNSAISDTLHFFSEDTRYEGEICFLIKNNAIDAVGFGLDLTKADEQNYLKKKALPWERSKSFDGAAVLGNFVKLSGDITQIRLELYINGVLIQDGRYKQMIYKPTEMIEEINSFMTLEDGDVIMSGTPKGVGTYKKDDLFEGKIYIEEELLVCSSWVVV
ncbi:MAG: fumarylacetoacetate hydrolase family protein [Arcobacteraceae bacterium]